MEEQIVEVVLPKLGESIVGATVVQWLKNIGEKVYTDEPLLEVSTDKVNSEIPSPASGILKEICVREDQEIEVGTLLARIACAEMGREGGRIDQSRELSRCPNPSASGCLDILSPAVLRLAQIEGISLDTLKKIEGSGEGGRITKKDIERYIQSRKGPPNPVIACPQISQNEERIALSGMRKAIAENMVRSFYQAPHASLVIEADVTDVMKLISREKTRFIETHGVKLTITSFLIQALTKAIQQFPMLNASLEGETIIMKRYVNVGIAVNIDKGLVVPVIRNCQERSIVSIAKAVAELSTKARSGKLTTQDVIDGSVTLTNFGMTGALIGVPIIRFPEVAIMGAGTVQKRAVVREDDSLAVRQMLYLTLTFDHRVIDGIYGCQFLSAFKQQLESVSLH